MAVERQVMATAPDQSQMSSGGPGARKLAARVAARIEADVLTAGWPVGQVLGSESDLRERYGVSRAVLREAIRLVEHHKVAAMRRGPNGGLVIRAAESGPLTKALVIYLEYTGTRVEDLLTVRRMLEPLAARLAASRLDETGIEALRSAVNEERISPPRIGTRDLLHLTLGRLSGNAVLRLFIDVMVELTVQYARVPAGDRPEAAEELQGAAGPAHTAILESVIAGDTSQAEHRMVKHLEAMQEWLLSTRQQPINAAQRPDKGAVTDGSVKEKLAETVARRMMVNIAASGAKPGDVIGSEADLLGLFGVSRAVLREAVRLLEHHSVARMRRGPDGGLIVGEPDLTASIEAAAIFLDYERTGVEDLRAVREVIEMGCLELVTRRFDAPEVVKRLNAAIDAGYHTPLEAMVERGHHVHTEIAALSNNPILALFLQIIAAVWIRHSGASDLGSMLTSEDVERVARVHRGIVDAVLAGDLPLASHRMRRHLKALDTWWT